MLQAAHEEEGIPAPEINEAFDDLAEFIEGEIEEAEREEGEEEDDEGTRTKKTTINKRGRSAT